MAQVHLLTLSLGQESKSPPLPPPPATLSTQVLGGGEGETSYQEQIAGNI